MISVEAVAAKTSQLSSPQMATYLAYSESPILRPRLKELSSNTARQQQQYSLHDIEAKCTPKTMQSENSATQPLLRTPAGPNTDL
jgi:hypothetical protein